MCGETGKAGRWPFDFDSFIDSLDPKCQLPLSSRGTQKLRSSLRRLAGPPLRRSALPPPRSGSEGLAGDLEGDTPQGCCVLVGFSREDDFGPGCRGVHTIPGSGRLSLTAAVLRFCD